MAKRKSECSSEEWERQKQLSRVRNKRYLAKADPVVAARRSDACKAYLYRISTNPDYADKNAIRKQNAVARARQWGIDNPDRVKATSKAARQRSPHKEVAKVQRRNAAKLQAIPSLADMNAITRHYENARYLSIVSGHKHHVDHIIPLRGETVCGLHVENNLRAIPHFMNTRKGNKLQLGE